MGIELRVSFVSGDVSADIVGVALARRSSLVLLGVHRPVFLSGSLGGVVGDDGGSAVAARMADHLREAECEVVEVEVGAAGAAADPAVRDACVGVDLAVCALTGPASLFGRPSLLPGMDASMPLPCSVLGVSAPG